MEQNIHTKIMGGLASFCGWKLFNIFCKGEIKNIQYLEELKNKPYIVTPNHTSHLDWIVLYELFRRQLKRNISFLAKKELFEHPMWKHVALAGGAIKLDRGNVTKDVLKSIYKSIEENKVIGIFPEGTRSSNGKLIQAKTGAIKLALMTGLPIVPVGLCGFYEVLPKGTQLPKLNKCEINIGKPIYFNEDRKKLSVEAATNLVMVEIAKLSNQKYNYA